jgi:hypothetical protein
VLLARKEQNRSSTPMAVISFRRNFIFCKTRKTAGTSLEVLLARHCGADDVVTQIFPARSDHHPRNFANGQRTIFYNHMTAHEIAQAIGSIKFENSFKFCFERHPVDKCLSHFAMLKNSKFHSRPSNPQTWEEYVNKGNFPIDTKIYTDCTGKLIVDKIFRYEELNKAIIEISARTGVTVGPLDIFEKSGYRVAIPSLTDVLNNREQRSLIMAAFAETLRFVDYE